MGNSNIIQSDTSSNRKCHKTDNASVVSTLNCCENPQPCVPHHQGQSRFQQKWEALPYVALVEIYKHLSNNDKACMGLTCKAWLLPFTRPALWRRGHFRFDGHGDQRALQFSALMGGALRHVVVDCSAPKEKVNNRAKASSVRFCLFLASLITADNRKLETLRIRNLCRLFRYWIHLSYHDDHAGSNPVQLLTNILEIQDRIRNIDVTNAGILTDQVIRLLESVQNPHCVEQLEITEVAAQIQRFDLGQHPRFISTIASYTSLKELRLSEEYISHELLMVLSSSVSATLRFLEISVLYKIRRQSSESLESSWDYFCGLMTKLKISFVVKGVFAARDIVRVLPSTVRLSALEWDLGNSVIDFKSFYLHLIKFKDFLLCLKLTLYFAIESDVALLSFTVQRLSNLKYLHIESPMVPPLLLYQLERCLRRCLNNGHPEDGALKHVQINGKPLESTETWYSYFAGKMMQQALNWQFALFEYRPSI